MKTVSCKPLEQYLSYLSVIKERSPCTIVEYCTDVSIFLNWLADTQDIPHTIVNISKQTGYSIAII